MFRFISHFIGLDIGDVHTATYHLHANAEQSEFRLPENAYMNQPLISIARTNLTLSLSLFLPFGWVYSFVWWWASILEPQPHNDSISIISIRISFQLILIVFTVDLRATNKCYSATHHNCKTKSQQQNIKTSEMHKIESHSHTHKHAHNESASHVPKANINMLAEHATNKWLHTNNRNDRELGIEVRRNCFEHINKWEKNRYGQHTLRETTMEAGDWRLCKWSIERSHRMPERTN